MPVVDRVEVSRASASWGLEAETRKESINKGIHSKREWSLADQGSLLRIADALESISKSLNLLNPIKRRQLLKAQRLKEERKALQGAERAELVKELGPIEEQLEQLIETLQPNGVESKVLTMLVRKLRTTMWHAKKNNNPRRRIQELKAVLSQPPDWTGLYGIGKFKAAQITEAIAALNAKEPAEKDVTLTGETQ